MNNLDGWDERGAHAAVAIGKVELGPALLDHDRRKYGKQVLASLRQADSLGLMSYLKWWLRDYRPYLSLFTGSELGVAVLARFLEADPEYWRMPLVSVLPKLNGPRRAVLLSGLVKFANKATVIALADVSGADVDEARKQLTRQQAPRLFVRTFGSLGIQRGSWTSQVRTLEKRRLRVLLGLLAAHSRQALSRDAALDILWPDAMPAAAVNNLNQSVFQLRRLFDEHYHDGESPAYILSTSESLQLDSQLVRVDVDEFRSLAGRLQNPRDSFQATELTRAAIELVRGGFLSDLRYEEWVQPLSDSIHAEIREVLLPLASGSTTSPDLAVRAGVALMTLDEYDESAVVVTAHRLAEAGRRTAARELITRFAKKLQDELDESPSPAINETMKALSVAVRTTTPT